MGLADGGPSRACGVPQHERACRSARLTCFTAVFSPQSFGGDKEGFISPPNQNLQRERSSLAFSPATGKAEVRWGDQRLYV